MEVFSTLPFPSRLILFRILGGPVVAVYTMKINRIEIRSSDDSKSIVHSVFTRFVLTDVS